MVDSGDDRYLFTFSPVGVTSFYGLPEERASKGVADWRMLRRKLPDEIFAGRRTLPHQLFGRDDVAAYLANVERALDAAIDELGASGAPSTSSTSPGALGHRVGLASWGGPGRPAANASIGWRRAFDVLDGSDSFVHPDAMAAVAAPGRPPSAPRCGHRRRARPGPGRASRRRGRPRPVRSRRGGGVAR